MAQHKYLKPNLVIEPLFMRWYAWSHLISPGTAAMNVVKRHMEIMNSYVDSPQQHMDAVKDPKTGNPIVVHQDNSYDMYVGRMFSLDASATWSFSKRFTLTAEANNLTNTPYVIYRGRPERPVKTEYYSIRALIGLRFTL
jgi:hypothetical protein